MSDSIKGGISPSNTRDPLSARWHIYNLVAIDFIKSGFHLQTARESMKEHCKRLNFDINQCAPFILPKLRLDRELFDRIPSASDFKTLRRVHEGGLYGKVRKIIINDDE